MTNGRCPSCGDSLDGSPEVEVARNEDRVQTSIPAEDTAASEVPKPRRIGNGWILFAVLAITVIAGYVLYTTSPAKEEPINVTKADIVRITSHGRQKFKGVMFDMVGGGVRATQRQGQTIVVIFRDLYELPEDFAKEAGEQKLKAGAAYLMTPDDKYRYGRYRYIKDVDATLTDEQMFRLFGQ
jgi:hypothetical protein